MKYQVRLVSKAMAIILILSVFWAHDVTYEVAQSQTAYAAIGDAQRQKLEDYAQATVRYFTSPQANNLAVGFTHAFFGTGRFRDCTSTCQEVAWPLTRGYGSHVNINEVTLRFLSLAAAYKMDWLDYLEASERYAMSWGQILTGLETLRAMQTSGNPDQFVDGHFHRTYLTTIAPGDSDRDVAEIVRSSGENIQSSDDNGLPFMNLLVLEGLASDPSMDIPDRDKIVDLCRDIRDAIDLKGFINEQNEIVHNFTNGVQSEATWDRLSAEGPIILTAMLLSGEITLAQFYQIAPSLENYPTDCPTLGGENIHIGKPSYHAAMFIHGLRAIHGMPVTSQAYPGADYFATSTFPVFRAQLDFAKHYDLKALGSQVMTQQFEGTPMVEINGVQARFPGNEDCDVPIPSESLARATGPHAWFIPLSGWGYLDQSEIDDLLGWMEDYEDGFFHTGSDEQLGWEAAIPWRPGDTTYTWEASDGTLKYTDSGRPYEALNAAYIVLSIFDALSSDAPLSSYHARAKEVQHIAAYFDNGVPLVSIVKTAKTKVEMTYQRQITYTLALRNLVGSVSNVHLTDTLPLSSTFAHWIEQPVGASVSYDLPQEITWAGSLSTTEPLTFTFVVTPSGVSCEKVCNTATYNYAGYTSSDSTCFSPCTYLPLVNRESRSTTSE